MAPLLLEEGVEGGCLRVEMEDADEGVSGIEANVDVPVVGRDDVMGELGENSVVGESESRFPRPTGRGGGKSRPRPTFVWIWWMLGWLALRERVVLRGAIEGRCGRSGARIEFAVNGGVGIPLYPSRDNVRPIASSSRCAGNGNCCDEYGLIGREGTGGVSPIGEK